MTVLPPALLALKSGTGRSLLTIARVALSSNTPSADHSILMILSVRTVKRVLPLTTIAASFALG